MEKKKHYHYVKFSPEAILAAWSKILTCLDKDQVKSISNRYAVNLETEEWEHDSESEFFTDYMKDSKRARFTRSAGKYQILIIYDRPCSDVYVAAPDRSKIEEIHQVFETFVSRCTMPKDVKPSDQGPTIFIGHGRSNQWRDLKDHLQDKHGYKIEAYEVGARAGHAIRDILEEMLVKSSIAFLVMSGEDKDEEGNLHARENVIHELGLFQGKLGFSHAIILLEEGTTEFSNIKGIHQIRYSKNNIKETFGDILATLRREFNKNDA